MKPIWKRWLVFLLILVMVLGILPVANASQIEPTQIPEETAAPETITQTEEPTTETTAPTVQEESPTEETIPFIAGNIESSIPKKNGKLRPLGIPSIDDKLVQEVVRMLLESIYENSFEDTSHGFRPDRSCHTALRMIQNRFTRCKWFVEGDIKGFLNSGLRRQIPLLLGGKQAIYGCQKTCCAVFLQSPLPPLPTVCRLPLPVPWVHA